MGDARSVVIIIGGAVAPFPLQQLSANVILRLTNSKQKKSAKYPEPLLILNNLV